MNAKLPREMPMWSIRSRWPLKSEQRRISPFLMKARDWARVPGHFHKEIEREHVVVA